MTDRDEAFRNFLNRVWRSDIYPLIADERAETQRKAAVRGAQAAGVAGRAIDKLLGLRGRPFSRALTVLGGTIGALTPDVWSWTWFRAVSRGKDREYVTDQLERRARDLSMDDAFAMLGLPRNASRDDVTRAWRTLAKEWHPDHAPDADARSEYAARFKAYNAVYESICAEFARSDGDDAKPRS